ncbi:MAG: TRAP transporter small permease [Pseudomonadota bacterium]
MAGASAVIEDGSLLSRLDKMLLRLETLLALASGLVIFSLMFLAFFYVSTRTLGYPTKGYEDIIVAIMPLIAILGISYVQRDGSHIRMDIVVNALSGRALWLFEFMSVLLILILVLALVYGSYVHFDRAFDCSRPLCSFDSTGTIYIPLWPSKLIVPIAFGVLALRLFIQLWGYGRAFVLGLDSPPAVPLRLSVDQQVQIEAASYNEADQ